MRTTIDIHFTAALPTVEPVAKAPFFPTYQLSYANEKALFYKAPSFGAILQQHDAFDVYITVLEVRAQQFDVLPLAIPIETLHRDLHWLYQIKGRLAIEPSRDGAGCKLELAADRQMQVYSPEMGATMYLTEQHTLSVSIAAKAKWLIRHQADKAHPIEKLVSSLREQADRCVISRDTAIAPAMPYLAELLSLPKLEGEPMDAAIAQPVGHLVRLARDPDTAQMQDPDTAFVATICRQVDNHIKAGHVPSVATLAIQNGLDARSLSERYRASSGHKLQTYIHKSRLTEGLRLLVEKRYTIGEAALAIGYAETSVFSKQFKKRYGQSPREYLKWLGKRNE